jgi:hypothetical protein
MGAAAISAGFAALVFAAPASATITDVVRVPWRGGKKRLLVRHAMSVSSNG